MSMKPSADAPHPLKALREAQQPKLSQNDLIHLVASRTGVQLSVQTVNSIENAKTVPTITTAQAIARALDVPTDAIAWPTPEAVRDNESSRRNRYFPPAVQTAMFAAIFSVASESPERRVSLDEALHRLEATLRQQDTDPDEIARALDRVRHVVAEEREKQQYPPRRAPRPPTIHAPDAR